MTQSTVDQNETSDLESQLSNVDKSNAEIKKYIYSAAAVGFIPLPLVDLAAVTGIQLKMIHSIAKIYKKPFSKEITKASIASLLGAVATQSVATRGVASLVKLVPVVGQLAGGIALATMSYASTYAVGKIFIKHFEAGGTLLDFNAESMREHFKKLFEEGELSASSTVDELKKGKS